MPPSSAVPRPGHVPPAAASSLAAAIGVLAGRPARLSLATAIGVLAGRPARLSLATAVEVLAGRPARLSLAAAVGVFVLAGCGAPPEPLPTAPPRAAGSGSVAPSGGAFPPGTGPTGTYPPGGLPTQTYPYPTAGVPTYPLPTTTVRTSSPSPSPTRSLPPAAPRCTGGPTRQQVLVLIADEPSIPERKQPVVKEGPFCAGSWQISVVGSAVEDPEGDEPLLVVTTGRPAAITLVVAGTDVCTDRVEDDAPPGIRVRACGF